MSDLTQGDVSTDPQAEFTRLSEAMETVREAAFDDGYREGYNSGYEDGRADGWDEGYDHAQED